MDSEGTRTKQPGRGPHPEAGPEDTKESGSDMETYSNEPGDPRSELKKIASSSDLDGARTQQCGSRSTEDTDLGSEPRDLSPVSRLKDTGNVLTNSSSEEIRDPDLNQGSEGPGARNRTRVIRPGSGLDQPGYTSEELQTSASGKTTDLGSAPPGQQESMPQPKPPGGHPPKLAPGETTNLQPGPNPLGARDLQPGSTSQLDSELKPDLYESALKPEPGSVRTGNRDPGLRFSRIPLLISGSGLKSEESPGPLPGPRLEPGSKSPVLEASPPGIKTELECDQSRSSLDPRPEQQGLLETLLTSPTADIQTTKVQPGSVVGLDLDLEPGSAEEHQPTSKDILALQSESRDQAPINRQSEEIYGTRLEEDPQENQNKGLMLSWEHVMDQVTFCWSSLV